MWNSGLAEKHVFASDDINMNVRVFFAFVPPGAVGEYGQVLLDYDEGGDGGFVHLAAALGVVDA